MGDSNTRPIHYECTALPPELIRPGAQYSLGSRCRKGVIPHISAIANLDQHLNAFLPGIDWQVGQRLEIHRGVRYV